MDRLKSSGKKVVIGLTGRIASSVAAILLKKQGMDVIGVSILTNSIENFSEGAILPHCHVQDLDKIKQFCQDINIPFYATDAKSQFEDEIFDEVIAKKIMGEANNSCFNCTRMKSVVLFDKMKMLNADFFATGHFCKIQQNINTQKYFIHSSSDAKSDQSYLFAGLSNDILERLILPLGDLSFEEVKKIGKKFGIDSSKSTKSYFCFEDKASYYNHGIKRIPSSLIEPGQVLEVENDTFLGDHKGIFEYKITQTDLSFNEGIFIDKKLQIVDYDSKDSVIRVGESTALSHDGFQLVQLELADGIDKGKPLNCFLKSRHNLDGIKCVVFFKNNGTAYIKAAESIYPVIKAENFVLYDKLGRNAKVIGRGEVGYVYEFKLKDRVSGFRPGNHEPGGQEFEYKRFFKF